MEPDFSLSTINALLDKDVMGWSRMDVAQEAHDIGLKWEELTEEQWEVLGIILEENETLTQLIRLHVREALQEVLS